MIMKWQQLLIACALSTVAMGASAEAFKPIASSNLLEEGSEAAKAELGGRFPNGNWAPLALADGKLLIRNHSILRCVKVAK